jgi:hypothetical protein
MGSDPNRSKQAKQFGELHERAKGFANDREGFQTMISGEFDEFREKGLANLATMNTDLGSTRTELKGHQQREFDINDAITYANETGSLISRGGTRADAWQNPRTIRGLESDNPLIAREAQLYWDELGRQGEDEGKDFQSSYMQGLRPEDMMGRYETGYGEAGDRLEALGLSNVDDYGFGTPLRKRASAQSAEYGSEADPWSRQNPWLFDPEDGSIWDEEQYAWTNPDTGEVTAQANTQGSDWMNRGDWGNMSNDLDGDGIPDIIFDASGDMKPLGQWSGGVRGGQGRGEYQQHFEDTPEGRIGPEGQTFVPGTGHWSDTGDGQREWVTEKGLSDPLGYDPFEVRDFGSEDFVNDETYSKRFFDPKHVGRGNKGRKSTAAAARMAAYLDKMGLDRASSEIDLLEQTPKTESALRRIEDLDKGIIGGRKSLADRAEFYGGFFS